MLGVKTREKSKKSVKETYWKGRTENNVKTWGKHLSKLDDVRKGNHVLCEKDEKEMIRKYDLGATVYMNVISQLKVKVHNGGLS